MNIAPYLGIGFAVFSSIINIIILFSVKLNDLKHVQKDLTEIKSGQLRIDEKLDNLSERVATIEGRLKTKR